MEQIKAQELEESIEGKDLCMQTLHLIDFLIKYGPTAVVDSFKENVYEFRKMDDFNARSGGIDQGESSK